MDINFAENENNLNFSTENSLEKDNAAISGSKASSEKIAKFQAMLNRDSAGNNGMRTTDPSVSFDKISKNYEQFTGTDLARPSDPASCFGKISSQLGQFINSDQIKTSESAAGFDRISGQSGQFVNADQTRTADTPAGFDRTSGQSGQFASADQTRTADTTAGFDRTSGQSGQFVNADQIKTSDTAAGFDRTSGQSGQFVNADQTRTADTTAGFDMTSGQSGQFVSADQIKPSGTAEGSAQIINQTDRFIMPNTELRSDPSHLSTQQNQEIMKSINQAGLNQGGLKDAPDMRNAANSIKIGEHPDLETFLNSQSAKTERPAVSDLSSIFSSLMSAQPNAPQEPSPAALNTTTAEIQSSKAEIQQMIDTLVDKILVSDPDNTAGSKIIMQMSSDSAFARTEIVLTRSNDGTLAVVINSGSQEQYRKLNESKEKLESSLQKLEKGVLTITVNPPVDEVQS